MRAIAIPMLLALLGTACLEEDFDADGFGISEDCDDHRATVNPDAVDTCNGMDDNCDGVIDDGATELDPGAYAIWTDHDGDGWGAEGTQRYTCGDAFTFPGTSLQGGDCDDDRYRVNPDGSGCGADFNCDGVPEPDCDDWTPGVTEDFLILVADTTVEASGADVVLTEWSGNLAVAAAGPSGVAVGLVGGTPARVTVHAEYPSDGTYFSLTEPSLDAVGGSLLIGAPTSLTDHAATGAFVLIDVRNDTAPVELTAEANIVHMGTGTERLGTDVATLDASAVGSPRFAVSAPGAHRIYAYEPVGFDYTEHSQLTGDGELGDRLVAVDLDGDGTADLAAGAPGSNGLWLVTGPLPSGTTTAADAGVWLAGAEGTNGSTMHPAGDLDGDGRMELVVSGSAGAAYLIAGMPSGGDVTAHPTVTYAAGGNLVASQGRDVNGDGHDDLLVGLPDEYRTGVMFGPLAGLAHDLSFDAAFKGGDATTSIPPLVGEAQHGLGDLNGDGVDDILYSTVGKQYVFWGGPGL